MKGLKRKVLCALAACMLFATGPCGTLDSWNVVLGPVFSGDTAFGGVELEFSNGVDIIVPLFTLGNNFDW